MDKRIQNLSRAAKISFSTVEGELLLSHLAEFCFADKELFVESSDRLTSYNAGRRSVYLHLKKLLEKELM